MAYLTSSFCKTEKACFVLLLMASSTATEMLRPQGSGAAGHQKMRGEVKHMQLGALRGDSDTFYVRAIKGVSRIYQQTFVDTYSK